MNIDDLYRLINEVLTKLGKPYYSKKAIWLLLHTCLVESIGASKLYQINGPARGIWQIEPNTEKDVWINFIAYRPGLSGKILKITQHTKPGPWLTWDLAYQIIIARLVYWRAPEPLPDSDDIVGQAIYWKRYYNTVNGKGSVKHFINIIKKYNPDSVEKYID